MSPTRSTAARRRRLIGGLAAGMLAVGAAAALAAPADAQRPVDRAVTKPSVRTPPAAAQDVDPQSAGNPTDPVVTLGGTNVQDQGGAPVVTLPEGPPQGG